MKWIGFTFVLFSFNIIFSQNDSINCYFEKGDKNNLVSDYLDEGVTELKTFIVIKRISDSLINHQRITFNITNVTENEDDIKLIKGSYLLDKNELLDDSDSLIVPIKMEIKNSKLQTERYFYINIEYDTTIVKQQLITIFSKESPKPFKKRKGEKMGSINLLNTNISTYNKLKIFHRESLKIDYYKKYENYSLKHKDRWFSKRFKQNDDKLLIDSVRLVISDGRVNKLLVVTDSGTFESKGPISLTNYYRRRYYRLHYSGTKHSLIGTYIVLNDFLNYIPETNKRYFPTSGNFVLNESEKVKSLLTDGNPNTFFDARIYTDLKALSGENNGLIQTEANAQFILNSNSFGRTSFTMFQFLKMGLSISKFDSKFDTLDIRSYDDTITTVRTLELVQNSSSSFKVEMDVFRIASVHDGYLSVGHNLFHTKTTDSLGIVKRIFTPVFYTTIGGVVFASNWLKAEYKLPLNIAYTYDQQFERRVQKWEFFISPEIEISIMIEKEDAEKEDKKRAFVFARVRYFDLPNVKGGNFWQIQTGVEVPISSLFNKEQ